MPFNADNCKRLHVGHSYPSVNYSIGGVERKLRLTNIYVYLCAVHLTPAFSVQVVIIANNFLGVINWTYVCTSQSNIMYLNKSFVRPHIEYCCQAWRTHLWKDIDNIDKVQRNAARITPEILSHSHQERLYKCCSPSHKMRFRSISILVYEIMKGFVKVETNKFFLFLEDSWTRSPYTDIQNEQSKTYRLLASDF